MDNFEPSWKTCIKCKQPKDTTEFNATSGADDTLRGDCKTCQAAYNKAYYVKHRERIAINTKLRKEHQKVWEQERTKRRIQK